jgi:hypothetical protein
VFISYAHESAEHTEVVRDLWILLRQCGIDAILDRVAESHRLDWTIWMADQIREADHILVIASPAYRTRAEGRAAPDDGRGVQWEASLIRDAFYRDQRRLDRFLPVVLPGQSRDGVPDFLTPHTTTVYTVEAFTPTGAEALLRLLTNQPAETPPPLGAVPSFASREHTLSTPTASTVPTTATPLAGGVGPQAALRHDVTLHLDLLADGRVQTRTLLVGSVLGEHTATLPTGWDTCWTDLTASTSTSRLAKLGQHLWRALVDEPTGRRLTELIDRNLASVLDVVVHLPEPLTGLPVELLRWPDGRLACTTPGVRLTRRLVDVDRPVTPPLPGPLKILAAVAAPEETRTPNPPLDVEAEMQALLDAVTDLDLGLATPHTPALGVSTGTGRPVQAQVRILEVASLTEIGKALEDDQYHVLHLSAHGSPTGVELEDEDGNPIPAGADDLIAALRAGAHPLPLVVLSSCQSAMGGPAGLAATLVRHGADRVIAMQTTITDEFATRLARELYRRLATMPQDTVAAALAAARRTVTDDILAAARQTGQTVSVAEALVPTLLAAGPDSPVRDPGAPTEPLARATIAPTGRGVRELPVGYLIGRRGAVRDALAVLRGSPRDRDRIGDRAGVMVTGIGGIGKTAVVGRVLARARAQGWMVAEHVGVWSPAVLFDAVANALGDGPAADHLRAPGVEDTAKFGQVLALVARERVVVLFDDFEQNLDTGGVFTDPGFAELFGALCAATQVGRVLVTSRYPVPDSDDLLLRVELPALSPAELRRLFLRLPALRELSVEDRRMVARTIGGHPRLIEFLDVLLRDGTAANFRHVTSKLRDLATKENIDLTPTRDVAIGLSEAIQLGSRDILLDGVTEHLQSGQWELLLQAALGRAPLSLDDLTYLRFPDLEATPDQRGGVRRDVDRLRDLTLLSPAIGQDMVVHPWVAASLDRHQESVDLVGRHERGAAMRLRRLNSGRGGFEDVVEWVRHLAGSGDYDAAVAAAFKACGVVGGEVGVSALLAEVVPVIPREHRGFLALADRECEALIALGLTSATRQRRLDMLTISEQRAAAAPNDAGYQRDLSISHHKMGDLAVAAGDSATAAQHYNASLATRQRLAAADPVMLAINVTSASATTRWGILLWRLGTVRPPPSTTTPAWPSGNVWRPRTRITLTINVTSASATSD